MGPAEGPVHAAVAAAGVRARTAPPSPARRSPTGVVIPTEAPAVDLVVPERTGSVVDIAKATRGPGGIEVAVTYPTEPGLYRLVPTLHTPSGVAYDAATQAMLTPVLVRIGGEIAVAYGAPANLTLNAGMEASIPVRVLNSGSEAWDLSVTLGPGQGGDDPTSGYHTSRFPAILTGDLGLHHLRPGPGGREHRARRHDRGAGWLGRGRARRHGPRLARRVPPAARHDLADQRPAVRAGQRPGPRPGHGHRGAAGPDAGPAPARRLTRRAAASPEPPGASSRKRKPADPPPRLGNTAGGASMDLMGTNVASVEPIRAASSAERLRVLLVAPPMVPVPPPTYAGTERVVAALGDELHAPRARRHARRALATRTSPTS